MKQRSIARHLPSNIYFHVVAVSFRIRSYLQYVTVADLRRIIKFTPVQHVQYNSSIVDFTAIRPRSRLLEICEQPGIYYADCRSGIALTAVHNVISSRTFIGHSFVTASPHFTTG